MQPFLRYLSVTNKGYACFGYPRIDPFGLESEGRPMMLTMLDDNIHELDAFIRLWIELQPAKSNVVNQENYASYSGMIPKAVGERSWKTLQANSFYFCLRTDAAETVIYHTPPSYPDPNAPYAEHGKMVVDSSDIQNISDYIVQTIGAHEEFKHLADRLAPNIEYLRRTHRDDYLFWESLGPETGPESCDSSGCPHLRMQRSLFCRNHHFEMIRKKKPPLFVPPPRSL